MATTSQVTAIRTTDKSHTASGERGGVERSWFPASLKGPTTWKVAVTHVTTFHNALAIIR